MIENSEKEISRELPFAAPCRELETGAPIKWLKLGWQDLRRAPKQSLTYGAVMLVVSYIISLLAYYTGELSFFLSLVSSFIFMGPVIAIGLYSISCQLNLGLKPRLGYCLREGRRYMGDELIFAFILLIVFLIWARAASMVHVFFPIEADPEMKKLLVFFSIGTFIGAIFTALIFTISAFSLPMIMDKKVDMITAIVTSINAVLRNKKVLLLWGIIIVALVILGLLTAMIGLVVLLPLIGHATWHAYKDTIDASAWPGHE